MSIKVEGLDDIARAVAQLKRRIDGAVADKVVLEGAQIIRDEYRATAPVGPTGRLRNSAQAFRGKKAARFGAFAIAWLKFRMAPESTLVEFGTHERFPKGKALKIPLGRIATSRFGPTSNGAVFVPHVQGVPPNPVFERSVNAKADEVLDHILTTEKELIEAVGR